MIRAAFGMFFLTALLGGCSGGSSVNPAPAATNTPAAGPASVRVVYSSVYGIDASQGVTFGTAFPTESQNIAYIYVYPSGGPRPNTPIILSYGTYGNISPTQTYPAGTYQVDVFPSPNQGTPALSESIALTSAERLSIVVAGNRASLYPSGPPQPATAQILNFVEPANAPGQTSVALHAASALNPMGFGFLPPGVGFNRLGGNIPQSLLLTEQTTSGPATPGTSSGGEYVFAPYTADPNAAFAVGRADTSAQPQIYMQAASSIAKLFPQFSSGIPSGTHLSIFVVDQFSPDNAGLYGFLGASDP